MALIKCPECGRENVSDTAVSCPACGFSVKSYYDDIKAEQEAKLIEEQRIQDEKEKTEQKKQKFQKNKSKIIAGSVIGVFFITSALIITSVSKSNADYSAAVSAYESSNYEEAYNYFKSSTKKDSVEYLEKTVVAYTNQLLDNNDLANADVYFQMITNSSARNELEQKMIYKHGINAYEAGAFDSAIELLKNIPEYESSSTYIDLAKNLNRMQGEWILDGIYYNGGSNKDKIEYNYAAIKINGWNAEFFHCIDFVDTFSLAGNCKISSNGDGTFKFKSNNLEYKLSLAFSSRANRTCINAEIVEDNYFENLRSQSAYYMWSFYGIDKILCFTEGSIASIKNDPTLTREPSIGMTREALENSTWGKPTNINKSTYSWGTTEQWCYSKNRYIYLDDGIVTAIRGSE